MLFELVQELELFLGMELYPNPKNLPKPTSFIAGLAMKN